MSNVDHYIVLMEVEEIDAEMWSPSDFVYECVPYKKKHGNIGGEVFVTSLLHLEKFRRI